VCDYFFAYLSPSQAALLVLDLLTAPGHVPRESRLRLQKWWKQRGSSDPHETPPKDREKDAPAVESTMELGENGVRVGAAWSQGRRPTMEDSHLLLPDLREELEEEQGCAALFGVFDGHGGQLAANMARDQLLQVCLYGFAFFFVHFSSRRCARDLRGARTTRRRCVRGRRSWTLASAPI
jgi:hypothetical protein